jgi:site-specific recombinase XerD
MSKDQALEIVASGSSSQLAAPGSLYVPAIIAAEGEQAGKRFLEFFTVNIRNLNTRRAYARAVGYFLDWCDQRELTLRQIAPMVVAAYIEHLTKEWEPQTVKQHLAAIRMLCDWLVIGQVLPFNPAASVKGPRYSYKKGKTPILAAEDMRLLLDSIGVSTVIGLRDRALIGLMFYSFGRVSAIIDMDVGDYFPRGKRFFIGLHEKGGKYHEVPVHHKAEEYLDAYLQAAGIASAKDTPLFRSFKGKGKGQVMTEQRMSRTDVWKMVQRRALACGIREEISPHSFRGTGITVYLDSGGTLEHAQEIANHASARTTKLYDRTSDQISLDEIERIVI